MPLPTPPPRRWNGSTSPAIPSPLWFAGYTFTTLGYGDLVPGGPVWKVLSPLAAGNGFLLFTLAVTYAIPIVSAATEKRQLALIINALGRDPVEIIERHAGKGDFQSLCTQLQPIQSSVAATSQKHLVYPILHYFHSAEKDSALTLALVRLDEALSTFLFACPDLSPAARAQLCTAQHVLDGYLHTLQTAFIYPAREAPPIPDLDACSAFPYFRQAPSAIREHLQRLDRQKLLFAYVDNDGWQWHDVW